MREDCRPSPAREQQNTRLEQCAIQINRVFSIIWPKRRPAGLAPFFRGCLWQAEMTECCSSGENGRMIVENPLCLWMQLSKSLNWDYARWRWAAIEKKDKKGKSGNEKGQFFVCLHTILFWPFKLFFFGICMRFSQFPKEKAGAGHPSQHSGSINHVAPHPNWQTDKRQKNPIEMPPSLNHNAFRNVAA